MSAALLSLLLPLGGALLLLPTALFGVDFAPHLGNARAVALLAAQMLLFAAVYALFFILQKLAGTVFLSQIGSVAAITGAAIAIGLLGEQGSLSMLLAALSVQFVIDGLRGSGLFG